MSDFELGDSVLISRIKERWGCNQHYKPWKYGSVTAIGNQCICFRYRGFFRNYSRWISTDDVNWRVSKVKEV